MAVDERTEVLEGLAKLRHFRSQGKPNPEDLTYRYLLRRYGNDDVRAARILRMIVEEDNPRSRGGNSRPEGGEGNPRPDQRGTDNYDDSNGVPSFFALSLPDIPDFLSDHTMLADEPERRLTEWCARWAQFVAGLWLPERRVTFCLRFDWTPATEVRDGGIKASLVWRCNDESVALETAEVERLLRRLGFRPKAASPDQHLFPVGAEPKVAVILQRGKWVPFNDPDEVIRKANPNRGQNIGVLEEYRFHPDMTRGKDGSPKQIYEVVPWWGAGGSFLTPFDVLTTQTVPTSVNIVLRPVRLDDRVTLELARVARAAQSMGGRSFKHGDDSSNRPAEPLTDPQLTHLGRVAAAHLRRLSHPFIASVIVASTDSDCCAHVTAAIAATIREETSFAPPEGESSQLPQDAMVLRGRSGTFGHLRDLTIGQPGVMTSTLEGLSSDEVPPGFLMPLLLTDARGASVAFRFPVNVRGGVPGIPVRRLPPTFDVGAISRTSDDSQICLGSYLTSGEGAVLVPIKDLRRHALITGFTGSGKTNTVKKLVLDVWNKKKVPFLIIEAAKQEYRQLLNLPGLDQKVRVYTLGDETTAPFRLNPFELMKGVRVEAHVSRLQACFDAALPPLGFLPPIISEALIQVYRRRNWTLTDSCTDSEDPRGFPTMSEFREVVESVVQARGYSGEVGGNIRAATVGRLSRLLSGSMGFMLDTPRTVDIDGLMNNPVVLELNDLNAEDKALVMTFLLTLVREYRELHKSEDDESLCHLTVVEEAHNVIGRVVSSGSQEGGGADTKAKSVEAFCTMLAEVRSLGEGLVISDQSPSKLAPDAVRNTNLQIAHQLRDGNDRDAIANSMVMDKDQAEYLALLEPGHAVMYRTGMQGATFVRIDRVEGHGMQMPSNKDVARSMAHRRLRDHVRLDLPFKGCELCKSQCRYRRDSLNVIRDVMPRGSLSPFAPVPAEKQEERKELIKAYVKSLNRQGGVLEAWIGKRSGGKVTDDELACLLLHHHGRQWPAQRDLFGGAIFGLVADWRPMVVERFERDGHVFADDEDQDDPDE